MTFRERQRPRRKLTIRSSRVHRVSRGKDGRRRVLQHAEQICGMRQPPWRLCTPSLTTPNGWQAPSALPTRRPREQRRRTFSPRLRRSLLPYIAPTDHLLPPYITIQLRQEVAVSHLSSAARDSSPSLLFVLPPCSSATRHRSCTTRIPPLAGLPTRRFTLARARLLLCKCGLKSGFELQRIEEGKEVGSVEWAWWVV